MSSKAGPTVAVKLFVDKEKQRVLFAESNKDFVDVLFSFLTLPLGTIVRLFGKQSGVGCLDELYKSVESLSIDHFQTEACKTMLLRPLSAAASQCEQLKVRVDDTNHRTIYLCSNTNCKLNTFSSVPDAVCENKIFGGCNGRHSTERELPGNDHGVDRCSDCGVFIQSGMKLIITDDLQVSPASTSHVFSLLDKFGLDEKADIKEMVIHLNSSKMINLLKRALISKQPLTGLYFDITITPNAMNLVELPEIMFPNVGNKNDAQKFHAIKIKLIQTADSSSVLYAEVGPDFIDLVFGLLTVPLGSIIKAYGQCVPNGCIDNLYQSVGGSARGCIRNDHRSMLLSPKWAPFFSCRVNALQIEELGPNEESIKCFDCLKNRYAKECYCSSSVSSYKTARQVNPKFSSGERDSSSSRGYIKGGLRNFIVTNDLRIFHFSLANTLRVMRASNIPKEKLVEKELSLDRTQVLKLMRAAIATREALSSVLRPPKKRRLHH